MIFNPLFIGENGSSQSLIPKPGKLAKNKYLFSDIVKVVMNPATTTNRKPSLRLDGANNKLNHVSEQKLVQLNYRLLTDEHSEQVKLKLADILPNDIAKLLINEELVTTNERAVSYISKEPLKGELQNFLNNLIGAEIIEQNISQKSGLLLNLEDQKSAVNIELVEDGNGKSDNDKIIVQTLVVPEKSRLLSMFGKDDNNEILFRTSGNSADKLFTSNNEIKLINEQAEIIKPTLSVYSFSHDGNQFESLTKNIKSNETFKHNLNLLKNSVDNSNLNVSKSYPVKISFVPNELKDSAINAESMKSKTAINKVNSSLKLVNQNEAKKGSDYSVSKITIVKKQDKNNLLNSVKSKSELTPKEFDSALRRIDFNRKSNAPKSDLHLIKTTRNQNTSTSNDGIKTSNSIKNAELESKANYNVNKELHTSKNTDSQIVNADNLTKISDTKNTYESIINQFNKSVDVKLSEQSNGKGAIKEINLELLKNKINKIKTNIESTKETSKLDSKDEIQSDKLSDSKVKESKVETKTESEKVNLKEVQREKLNIKLKRNESENKIQQNKADQDKSLNSNQVKAKINTVFENEVKQFSEGKSLSEKPGSEPKTVKIETKINDVTAKPEKNDSAINVKGETKISETKISEIKTSETKTNLGNINKSVSVDQPSYESKANSDFKTEMKNNTSEQEKIVPTNQGEKVQGKDNSQVQKENQEVKAALQNIVNSNVKNTEAKDNRKFSVKMKSGIKSVSDKNNSIKNSIEEKSSNSNASNNNASNSEGSKSESSESKQTQNSSIQNKQFEMKQHVETNFQQTVNKSEIGQINFGDTKTTFAEQKSAPQIIKSVEVIKAISEFISKKESGSLSFDIRPEHLGKMKITLDTVDKMLKANIEVETEQAKHLVEKNIDKLQQQLSNNGLQLNYLNISLSYSKQQRDSKKINNKTENEPESLGQAGEAEEEQSKKQLGYNTYEYIA